MNEIGCSPSIDCLAQVRVSVADRRENRSQVEHYILTNNRPRNIVRLPKVAEYDFDIPLGILPSQFLCAFVLNFEHGYRVPATQAFIHDNRSDVSKPTRNQDVQFLFLSCAQIPAGSPAVLSVKTVTRFMAFSFSKNQNKAKETKKSAAKKPLTGSGSQDAHHLGSKLGQPATALGAQVGQVVLVLAGGRQ